MNVLLDLSTHGLHGLGSDYLQATARVLLGAFFAIMGAYKLFTQESHEHILQTMRDDAIPFPVFNAWFVSGVEFFAGLALVVGLLTPLASLGLFSTCLVATCTDGLKRIPHENVASWYIDFLYLPEVLYLFSLAYFVVNGPGALALDNLL